jgi:hypothetical protein
MSQEVSQGIYLPRCVAKFELITYFGCDYKFLWSRLIPDELLHQWGYDSDLVRKCRRLDPELTQRIYLHHRIVDLNSDYSAEIAEMIATPPIRLR